MVLGLDIDACALGTFDIDILYRIYPRFIACYLIHTYVPAIICVPHAIPFAET